MGTMTVKAMTNVEARLARTSYTDLGRRVGVSGSAISFIMAGKRQPALDTFKKLAKELGVTMEELARHLEKVAA